MKFVQPAVFVIGKMMPQFNEIAKWMEFIGCDKATVSKYSDPNSGKTPAEVLVELAGRRCYLSFQPGLNPNVRKIREDILDYITNIMKSKHGSVLEHYSVMFAVENVSRVLTAELNRHRAGVAISEGSMRYILGLRDNMPIVDVSSIQYEEDKGNGVQFDVNKRETRRIITSIVSKIELAYAELLDTWADVLSGTEFAGKKHITSMMRRIIPMGVATGGCYTFNLRSLRHVLTMRCSEAAEEEILRLGEIILHRMVQEEPSFFGDFARNENGFYQPVFSKV